VADRLGLSSSPNWALVDTRERRPAHDPGRVFCDLAVIPADGALRVGLGRAGLAADAVRPVASGSTARRVLLSVGEAA
jgi:hypothetical protein